MKRQSTLIFALLICYSAALCQTPAITMTSSMALGSTFYFHIRGTNPDVQIDFGDGILVNRTIDSTSLTGLIFNAYGTDTISGKLKGSKTVKIYGSDITALLCYLGFSPMSLTDSLTSLDVSNCNTLKWLDCSGSQLTALDLSKNTLLYHLTCSFNQLTNLNVSYNGSLKYLDCGSNKLTTLDVSKNTALNTLHCAGNPFTKLDISNNTLLGELRCYSNNLTTLNVSNNTALGLLDCSSNNLTNLDVSNNTVLWWLNCSQNLITALDVGSNTFLKSIFCGYNPITSLDLTHNNSLAGLNCNACQLTSLDVSHNSSLTGLSCAYNQLTSLDISNNTVLMTLRCPDNRLTSLDLSANTILNELDCSNNLLTSLKVNTNLVLLYCYNNRLTSLDVSKNTQLALNVCHNNQFTFATLPTKPIPTVYAPQSPIFIDKVIGTGTQIDLSSQLTVNWNTTVYTWKFKSGATLVPGTDYSLTDGKTMFLKSQPDSVYCEMTNATFPFFTGEKVLKTTCTKVTVNTGIDNVSSPAVQIYTRNKTLYIVALYNGLASVYDINGRLAMAKEITTGANTIALPKGGVYVVRLSGSKTPLVKKVFVGN